MQSDERLIGLRQGMRIQDRRGEPVGYVRDVSKRAVLVSEQSGHRVFWLDSSLIDSVGEQEIRLRTEHATI